MPSMREVPEAGAGSAAQFLLLHPGTQQGLGTTAGNTGEVTQQGQKNSNNKVLQNTFYKTETNPGFRCTSGLERKIIQKRFPCLHYTCLLLSIVPANMPAKGFFS